MSSRSQYPREFVRTFFTSLMAVEDDDSVKMLRSASKLRGMQAPDAWVPDNEDVTAPSMCEEGVGSIIEVVSEHGSPPRRDLSLRRLHRDNPSTDTRGSGRCSGSRTRARGAVEHADGFVIPEVGDVDDWKTADECLDVIESGHGLERQGLLDVDHR